MGATSSPRILVLMATFNGATWIRDQVHSIASQEDVAVTVAISDDDSSDDTLAQALAAGVEGIRFEVIRSTHSGGTAARNFFRLMEAVDAKDHDFIALADQDDVWEPAKLARAAESLVASEADGYSASVCAFWPDGRTALLSQRAAPSFADYLFEGAGQGCTFMLRTASFVKIQGLLSLHREQLNEIHYHDWTLYALCRVQRGHWFFDDWICMRYRQHAGNDTGARSGSTGIKRRLALIRSGWYGAQVEAIARLCASVAGGTTEAAVQYLRLVDTARSRWSGRLPLCLFVLRHGRRRWSDRLMLVWAAACGYLTQTSRVP